MLVQFLAFCALESLAFGKLVEEDTSSLGAAFQNDAKLQALFDWVQKHGGKGLENFRIRLFEKGGHKIRGLAASRDIVAGSEVLSIPTEVILSFNHSAVRDSPFQEVSSKIPGFLRLKLPLFLAAERRKNLNGNATFWAPFIASMPTPEEFASFHPYYGERGTMADFSALTAVHNILHDVLSIEEQWKDNQQHWTNLAEQSGVAGLTFEDFKWACTVAMTRGYKLDSFNALVPISDLHNHAASPSLDWKVAKLTGSPLAWRLFASRNLREGEEFTKSYGHVNNEYLLWTYGFIMGGNDPNPVEAIRLDNDTCSKLPKEVAEKMIDKMPQAELLRSLQGLVREQCKDNDEDEDEDEDEEENEDEDDEDEDEDMDADDDDHEEEGEDKEDDEEDNEVEDDDEHDKDEEKDEDEEDDGNENDEDVDDEDSHEYDEGDEVNEEGKDEDSEANDTSDKVDDFHHDHEEKEPDEEEGQEEHHGEGEEQLTDNDRDEL